MSISWVEHKDLVRMRENVCQNINSLEVCSCCDRVSECEQFLINESFLVWLCRECSLDAAHRFETPNGVPVTILPYRVQETRTEVETESAIATPQVWTRRCRSCNAMVEKARSSEKWICKVCGWKESA
jgi:alkylhydroperoxidase family enzyme